MNRPIDPDLVLHDEGKFVSDGRDDGFEPSRVVRGAAGLQGPVGGSADLGVNNDATDRTSPISPALASFPGENAEKVIAEIGVGDVVAAHRAVSETIGGTKRPSQTCSNAQRGNSARKPRKISLVDLRGRGWCVACPCVAVIRLRDRPGFAVGVQERMRSGGVGRIWPGLKTARRRAAFLAALNRLPIVESV